MAPTPRVELPLQRIAFLKERIRMRDVMTHFGHRYRTHGNMICCWHDERNPSARLYDEQDTYWCWVCSPNKGVDIIEFVIIQLGLEADVDPSSQLPEHRRHSLATLRAIPYLEQAFNLSFDAQPWEVRLAESLRRPTPHADPNRYWHQQHVHVLRQLSQLTDPVRWYVYSDHIFYLRPLSQAPIPEQSTLWTQLHEDLSRLT